MHPRDVPGAESHAPDEADETILDPKECSVTTTASTSRAPRIQADLSTLRLLDSALLGAPLAYLALDCSYAVRGWDDGPTAALHILAAALYGIAALRLVSLNRGRVQAVLLVVAVLGMIGNAGVGENTLHVALGGNDLFDQDGPANLFKAMGFFFPLTFLITALALRSRTPAWWSLLLALGAVLFPVAHVGNVSWLAIVDALLMLLTLGSCLAVIDRIKPENGHVPEPPAR
jgi:hypothetical protein